MGCPYWKQQRTAPDASNARASHRRDRQCHITFQESETIKNDLKTVKVFRRIRAQSAAFRVPFMQYNVANRKWLYWNDFTLTGFTPGIVSSRLARALDVSRATIVSVPFTAVGAGAFVRLAVASLPLLWPFPGLLGVWMRRDSRG